MVTLGKLYLPLSSQCLNFLQIQSFLYLPKAVIVLLLSYIIRFSTNTIRLYSKHSQSE